MSRIKIFFIVAILLSMVTLIYYYLNALKVTSNIDHGEIDLSKTNFNEKGVITLDGEWEFYWNQLLDPDDFTFHKQDNMQYSLVPGNWLGDKDGNTYDPKGYATYRVKVKNIPSDTKYFGVLKENIRNSSRIFVNGEMVLKDGEISESMDGSVSGNNSQAAYFKINSSTAEIIVQAANHDYIVGGIAKPITLGKQKEIMELHQRKVMFEFAMILIVVIIGLFYLFLFFVNKDYRKKEPATLPLALSCLFYGVMSGIYSERIITVIFPAITLDGTFRFGHLMSAFTVSMVLIVVNQVNPVFLSNKIRNAMLLFYGLFASIILIFPLAVYSNILVFYMLFTVVFYFIVWIRILVLFIKKNGPINNRVENGAMIVTVFSIYLFWFDMILYSLGLKIDMVVSFLTIPVYSIALSILLIVRYTHSYKKNEELSIQLIETFSTLDQTTKKAQRSELAFLQAQIKPHFLFNTLSSIISLCYTDGNRAGKVLLDLSNYLKRSFQIDIHTDYVTLEDELNLIKAYVDIEKVRFGDRIDVTYDIDEDILSFKIIPLVIEPLVENAIRHGVLKNINGGEVKLVLKRQEQGIYICVEDNGKGIDEHQLNRIRNGEGNLQSLTGNGISLTNIYTRLQSVYQVELQFDTDHRGTKVSFTIPLNLNKEETADD